MLSEINVVGGDTETVKGKPFCMQFYSEKLDIKGFVWCSEKNASRKFTEFCETLPEGETIIYFHNLDFDLVSIFYEYHVLFTQEEINLDIRGWKIEGIFANVKFVRMTKGNRKIHILDTAAFFKTSLAKLSALFTPDLPKLDKPQGLGNIKFTDKDKEFCDYAMRDSEITYHIGEYLLERHIHYRIPLCVSAPHFAANIFTHHYIKNDIPLPNKSICFSALHSYHGGKNNITVPAGFYKDVKSLDIISAYPAAMRELPSFYDATKYKTITGNGHPEKALPRYGIYRISGVAKDCMWPIIFDHKFSKIYGDVDNIWVTGPELNAALQAGEIRITSLYGYYYSADQDDFKNDNPFRKFVDDFFKLKNEADKNADQISREFYKLMLNSLYGKFIQSRGNKDQPKYIYDLDKGKLATEKSIIAGGLFHPFIASLITGIVRAQIHSIEHRYSALHTATDGIFTLSKSPRLVSGLGGLKLECEGDLLLFRNKLYILYGKKGKFKSSLFKDRWIIKYALHGFHGSVYDLEKIYITGNPTYQYKHMNRLKESLRHGYQVNEMETKQGSLVIEEKDNGNENN